jgi:DNA end-binding protein Ku
MRSIWNGTLRFGLVAIPVGLVPARVDRGTGFRTLHRECGTPVSRRPWCSVHERVLEADELVSGYEIAKGQFIPVEESELAALVPEASNTIQISCLLDSDRIDPARIEKTYYLSASGMPIGRKPYILLHRVLVEQKRTAIARLVYRGAEWVVAVQPHQGRSVLLLQKLAFADELVDPTELEIQLREIELQDRELELGRELGAKLWRTKPTPELFKSEHQARVRQVVDAKLAGGTITTAARAENEPEAPSLPTVDLTEQLRASLRRRTAKQTKSRAGTRSGKR